MTWRAISAGPYIEADALAQAARGAAAAAVRAGAADPRAAARAELVAMVG
jgi:hypothetical protein